MNLKELPDTAYRGTRKRDCPCNLEIEDLDKQAGEMLADRAPQLVAARDRLEELSNKLRCEKTCGQNGR